MGSQLGMTYVEGRIAGVPGDPTTSMISALRGLEGLAEAWAGCRLRILVAEMRE